MTDSALNYYLASGTATARAAFTPSPPTPASGPGMLYIWYETDTGDTYAYHGGSWSKVNTGSALVTSANKSANFTTDATHNTYFLDTSGGAYTVTMNATPATNEVAEIWDSTGHATANPVSFNGNGKNIAGSATLSNFISANYGHARLIYNGTQWLAQ